MKRFTITLVATFVTIAAIAQQPFKAYCEVWGNSSDSRYIGYAYIDYGQKELSYNWFVNDEGKGICFNSMIEILNYMSKCGWELETVYDTPITKTVFDETRVETKHTLILSKVVTSNDEITEGIYTKNMYRNRYSDSQNTK